MTKALVLLSGGQDSTTCAAWAKARFTEVYGISFDYGQRHRVELDCALDVAGKLNIPLKTTVIPAFGGSALINDHKEVADVGGPAGLPTTFVPGRNAVFLSVAAAYASTRGITNLVVGMCQTDYSGYPDCREEFRIAMEVALSAALPHSVAIHTPLMHLTKAETIGLAQELGVLRLMASTHTCYLGERPPCGECPACRLRAKGFKEAGLEDPLCCSVSASPR